MAQAPKELPSPKRFAISGTEMILLILLVIGLWIWMKWAHIDFFGKPDEQQFITQRINIKQDELARLEAVRKDAANQLLTAEIDQLKQRAARKSLETLHPNIEKLQQGASTSIPAEAVKSYEAARAQELAAGELIALLNARIETSSTNAESITKELQSATEEFQRAQTKESAVLLLLPLVIIVLPLWVARRVASGQVRTSQGSILFSLVVCALFILFAYRVLQLTSAILIGTILFLFLLRKIRWSSNQIKEADRMSR